MLRLHAHPSVLVWLNGSDHPPPPGRETARLEIEKANPLPKARVKASIHFARAGHDEAARVTIENTSSGLAFLVRLRLLQGAKGKEILPVFWDDNYLCLLPGEKREVSVKLRKSNVGSTRPVLAVDGFNVTTVTVP